MNFDDTQPMKEIGGYLEFERFYGKEYHDGLFRFDSVRSALMFVVERRGYRKLYLPLYLCGCIMELLAAYSIKYDFYAIDEQFHPVFDKKLNEDECLFLVNYFGQFSNDEIQEYHCRYHNLFVDSTQAFFQKPAPGVDTAYSCRKYFGVSDGAYLSMDTRASSEYERLPVDDATEKMRYIMGRFETSGNRYYSAFAENEKINRGQPVKRMSRLIQNILKGIDYQRVIDTRRQNMRYLAETLNEKNQLHIKHDAGLFFYPLLVENGNALKRKLIERKIYVPTLWPNVLEDTRPDTWEHYCADNIVFLPVDQRYDREDMEYMVRQVMGE